MQNIIQERIERMYQTKRSDIKWLNSLNNATQIVASQLPKGFKNYCVILDRVRKVADWYDAQYALKKIAKKQKVSSKKISNKRIKILLKKARAKVQKGGRV